MRSLILLFPLLLSLSLPVGRTALVNPFVGTDAHGHTFPGACYPFGMVQLSPDTRPRSGDWDGCSGYHYSDSLIYGFSHTHLSGTGCDDWCDILVTPGNGPSHFSHDREKASPGYYEVFLEDPRVQARLTVGRRVGVHEYTFPKGEKAVLRVDLRHRDVLLDGTIESDGRHCWGRRRSRSWAHDQDLYYYMEFSSPADFSLENDGKTGVFRFGKSKVTLRVALSSVSVDNARENLRAEPARSFRDVRAAADRAWEDYLSKVDCPEDASPDAVRTFYTALYHTAIHPSLYSDANGEYRGMDRQVHRAEGWERYNVFSLWDTFRGEHPLLCMIEPERTVDFIRTMISVYEEAGKLPVWELSGNETNCMIGYNAAPVIADALARGITDFDVEKAFEAMVASSLRPEFGMDSFRANGLVLADDEHESVSKTLEYAYDDWCVAQVARYLGREEEYAKYMESAQYWRNVLDPSTGFMRARLNGRWFTPFDPREVNNNYTEANAWQYSLFVPQDIRGLIDALGGEKAFEERLDALFAAEEATTGRVQADITGLIGQYAHGNEPSHHVVFLYDLIGRKDKREARVRQILGTLYSPRPDGLCGNDDCGQMSAWYVLAALGQYPYCPAWNRPEMTEMEKTIVTNPYFIFDNDIFQDSLTVSLGGEGTLYYRCGGEDFRPYAGPFVLRENTEMEAYAEKEGKRSFVTRSQVHKIHSDRTVEIRSRYSRQYTAGGNEGLIDGARGNANWRTGGWQGYQDTDFEAVVDFLSERNFARVGAGFCQDVRSWIWMPRYVEFSVSSDGIRYEPLGTVRTPVSPEDYQMQIWDCSLPSPKPFRYLKVFAKNIGTIPDWHPGAGYPGYIFIDEIWALPEEAQ